MTKIVRKGRNGNPDTVEFTEVDSRNRNLKRVLRPGTKLSTQERHTALVDFGRQYGREHLEHEIIVLQDKIDKIKAALKELK